MMTKEELVGKCLPYSENITEEVWDRIIAKLGELGIRKYNNTHNDYSDFQQWGQISIRLNSDTTWVVSTDRCTESPIDASDILGDDWNTQQLSEFPKEGQCKYTKELEIFLKKKFPVYGVKVYRDEKLIAWNSTGFWFCNSSGKPLFKKKTLKPFISEKVKVLTPDKLIEGNIYYYKCDIGNFISEFYKNEGDEVYDHCWISVNDEDFEQDEDESCIPEKIREATPEEKKWLKVCKKKGQFVDEEDLDDYDEDGNPVVKVAEPSKNEWWKSLKKGDYIVFNTSDRTYSAFKFNFIYKVKGLYSDEGYQRIFNSDGVKVEKDSLEVSNGWAVSLFRKATPKEIKMYEHADKPVDVTTYKISEEAISDYPFKIGETVKLVTIGSSVSAHINGKQRQGARKGDIVTITGITTEFGAASEHDPRYYGENFNVRGEDLEKIQESKEFVLPEKWCVRDNNQKELGDYFNKQSSNSCYPFGNGYLFRYNLLGEDITVKGNHASSFRDKKIRSEYTEITFEQFKEHVLKEKGGEMKEMSMKEKLNKKYLYFKPEWSFELFKKIYDKLELIGFKCYHPIDEAWRYCNSEGHKYFHIGNDYGFNKAGGESVVIIEDILGKDWDGKTSSPSTELTGEALLEEAKKRYPVGTKFHSTGGYKNCMITAQTTFKIDYDGDIRVSYVDGTNSGSVYSGDTHVWAEIVSSPKEKSVEKWSVGSYVVAIKEGHARSKTQDKYSPGFISKVTHRWGEKDPTFGAKFSSNICNKSDFKWFATKEEAEAFAKTLKEPEKLTTSNLIEGVIYHASYMSEEYIFDLSRKYLCVHKTFWSISFNIHGYYTYRKATEEEQEWFNACKKANRFIPKEKVLKTDPKFEVGKWYKNLGTKEDYIAKFVKITNNSWICEEYIWNGSLSSKRGNLTSTFNNAVECSLEEIQKYLPDGHVDKIKKEKKNVKSEYVNVKTQEQWDFVTEKLGYNWKSSNFKGSKDCINTKEEFWSSYIKYESGDYITFEQWLKDTGYTYPENKFNYKFKIGDKVKVIESGSGCSPTELNEEVEIIDRGEYFRNPGYKVSPAIGNTANGSHGGFIGEESFELTSSEEEEYKVGDWVYVVYPERTDGCKLNKGDIVQIKHIRSFNPCILATEVKNGGEIYDKDVRKATPEEISKAKGETTMKKFQKGKWYVYTKHKGNETLICYKESFIGYGFWRGVWGEHKSISDDYWREASDKEVEEKLLAYAKEKYPIGTIYINVVDSKEYEVTSHTFSKHYNDIWGESGKGILMRDSKWAKIISKPESSLTSGLVDAWEISESSEKPPSEMIHNPLTYDEAIPSPRWKVGDKVTYKSIEECGGGYKYDGADQNGYIGTINEYLEFVPEHGCYKINVTTNMRLSYSMLESEFREWEEGEFPKTKTNKIEVQLIDVPRI